MKLPKLVVTDIDGVWTDGGMYYDESGNELKKFHTYDSAGVLFLRLAKIPVAICTGERTNAVQKRADKLKIDHLFQGVKNKVDVVSSLVKEMGISMQDVAYIGDDINDVHVISKVGLSACPSTAPAYVQSRVDHVLNKGGGQGVFREFVEDVIFGESLESFLKEHGVLPDDDMHE